jgi:hypothetical protein
MFNATQQDTPSVYRAGPLRFRTRKRHEPETVSDLYHPPSADNTRRANPTAENSVRVLVPHRAFTAFAAIY